MITTTLLEMIHTSITEAMAELDMALIEHSLTDRLDTSRVMAYLEASLVLSNPEAQEDADAAVSSVTSRQARGYVSALTRTPSARV